MIVNDIVSGLSGIYPESFQESYDNTGSQVLFPGDKVNGVYVSLDVDMGVIDDAFNRGCNMILCHHPLLFRPVKKIISAEARSSLIIELVQKRISLYAMHTNYDKFMYSELAAALGFNGSRLLLKTDDAGDSEIGFGSVAVLDEGMIFADLLRSVKDKLGLDYLLYSGEMEGRISSIAFINGAGGGSVERVIARVNPDCIITGDMGYHNARYIIDSGKAFIDAGHFGTEIIFKKMLAQTVTGIMKAYGENRAVVISGVEKNPLRLYI